MNAGSLNNLVAGANAAMRKASQAKKIGEGYARFELYHAAPSLCSHKVRTVLAEKGIPYLSHDMRIVAGKRSNPDNYHPGYVRLRLQGAPNAKMVSGYTGQSSVATEGFDPCVVPTLVDHDSCAVIIDSSAICFYLDREGGQPNSLAPEGDTAEIHEQVHMVDTAPHVASLYGAHPDDDVRPKGLQMNIKGVHTKKIRALEEMISQVGDDPDLVTAYRSKISKEARAGDFVYDANSMRKAHSAMANHVAALERQLGTHNHPWVMGSAYTLADIMWTVSLYRVQWLGLKVGWEKLPRVNDYLSRAFERPSFQSAVVRWPGAYSPSPYTKEFSGPMALLKFLWANR